MIQTNEEGGLLHHAVRCNQPQAAQSQKFAFSLEFNIVNMKRIPLSLKRIKKILEMCCTCSLLPHSP